VMKDGDHARETNRISLRWNPCSRGIHESLRTTMHRAPDLAALASDPFVNIACLLIALKPLTSPEAGKVRAARKLSSSAVLDSPGYAMTVTAWAR
jgi:hypothetical protein